MDRETFATGLECLRCGREIAFAAQAYLCPSCGQGAAGDAGILDVRYDYRAVRDGFPNGAGGIFRYSSLLPISAAGVALLPAGGTPLLAAPGLAKRLGVGAIYLKDEGANPTGCLKDRATAVGVAMAAAAGHDTLYCASAGNAAISLAGFCAHAGLACHVWVPAGVAYGRLERLRAFGAEIHVSPGDYDGAFDEAELEGRANGWYGRSCAFNPFLVEGKKTVAFEIAEQLGWAAPDLVVAPVGDGCTLAAAGKGFRELRELGRTGALPRLVGVQAEAMQPLVRRFRGEPGDGGKGDSRAASINVRRPRNARRLLRELDACGGTMLAVPDDAIECARRLLADEAGVNAEFTSAAALAGLARLAEDGSLAGRSAVVIVTAGDRG